MSGPVLPVGQSAAVTGPADTGVSAQARALFWLKNGLIVLVLWRLLSCNVLALWFPQALRPVTQFCGLATRWRMFSPPDFMHWEYRVYAVRQDGTPVPQPLPSQLDEGWWKDNMTDFRERKWELNVYADPMKPRRQAWADYLCRTTHPGLGGDLRGTRIDLEIRRFLPADQAAYWGRRYDRDYTMERDFFSCRCSEG